MLLDSHISAYARCSVGKVCGLVRSTWGTSLGEDKRGARARILNTKVARRANIPPELCILSVPLKPLLKGGPPGLGGGGWVGGSVACGWVG